MQYDPISSYLNLVNSQHYNDYISQNPAGESWTEYRNEFKNHVVDSFRGMPAPDVVNLLIKSGAVNSPYNFPDEQIASDAINWHLNRVKNNCFILDYFPEVQESSLMKGNAVKTLEDGRRFSLDTFRYLAYIEKIEKKLLEVKKVQVYLELGSGNGGFARVLKLLNPNIKIILVDLPEVLFTSSTYLNASFPNADHLFVSNVDELTTAFEGDYDFLYLSHHLLSELLNMPLNIDLFCNMRSIGEMPAQVTSAYEQIIKNLNIKHIFLENRYFNAFSPIHKRLLNFRKDEITGSTWMAGNWNTVDFELEPAWAKSPYETDHPRYLSLCLSTVIESNYDTQDFDMIISRIKQQYWYSKFFQMRPWNLGFNPLMLDETTSAYLWEINRKRPTKASLCLILDFITYYFSNKNVEEYEYYSKILSKKYKHTHKLRRKYALSQLILNILKAPFRKISVLFRKRRSRSAQVLKEYE
jgi:putative sugar O-methyltransferase